MPVDVGSGALHTLSDDFVIPGSLTVRWRRHYSTAVARHTRPGRRWTVPYFMRLERRSDRYVLSGAHGEEQAFAAPTGPLAVGAVLALPAAKMELCREPDQYRVLHWHTDGPTYRFCFRPHGHGP